MNLKHFTRSKLFRITSILSVVSFALFLNLNFALASTHTPPHAKPTTPAPDVTKKPLQSSYSSNVDYSSYDSSSVVSGDFNEDGYQDIAVGAIHTAMKVYINNGDGTLAAGVDYSNTDSGCGMSVVTGDFDEDGHLDLISDGNSGNMCFFKGNGDGTFQSAVTFTRSNSSNYAGNSAKSMAVGDFNGDHHFDLVANTNDGHVDVMLGNGNGTFQTAVEYQANPGSYVKSIIVGDFNEDGNQDLAVTNPTANTVSILFGKGDGTFFNATVGSTFGNDAPGATNIQDLDAADFNGDGHLDLAVTTSDATPAKVLIFLGAGDGTFTYSSSLDASFGPIYVLSKDLNGDGKPDVAVTGGGGITALTFLGNGDGTFQTGVVFDPFATDGVIIAPDLNNDGQPDLVTTRDLGFGNKWISVYLTNSLKVTSSGGVSIIEGDLGTNVTEGGKIDFYKIKLDSQPSSDVTIHITPDSQLSVSPTTLTFTHLNWATPQNVTVSAINNSTIDGNRTKLIAHTDTSSDLTFNGTSIPSTSVYITDDDAYQASDLLGQLDGSDNPVFTTSDPNNGGSTSDRGFQGPNSIAVDTVGHRLFVGEWDNNRIMVFNLDSNNDLVDHLADYVIGQINFSGSDFPDPPTQKSLNGTFGMSVDSTHHRLYVSDSYNHRVLVFDVRDPASPDLSLCGYTSNGLVTNMNASCVLGHSDFITNTEPVSATQSSLDNPNGLVIDPDTQRLYVADEYGGRAVVYDVRDTGSSLITLCGTSTTGISNGMNASCVIGEPDFNTSLQTDTQDTLYYPMSVAIDTTKKILYVGSYNSLVKVYDVRDGSSPNETNCGVVSTGISNGMDASCVIGQPDFSTTDTRSASINSLGFSNGMEFDQNTGQLYYVDSTFNRVSIFDTSTLSNNMNASAVIGQADFSYTIAGTTRGKVDAPFSIAIDSSNNRAYVTDYNNNRVLIYDLINISNSSLPDGAVGAGYSSTLETSHSQGTVTFALTSGTLPTGLTIDADTGAIVGTPTTPGTYNFKIKALDTTGVGPFTVLKDFSITVASGGGGSGGTHSTTSGGSSPMPLVINSTQTAPSDCLSTYLFSPSTGKPCPPSSNNNPSSSTDILLTKTLKLGDTDPEVLALQKYLNTHKFILSSSGPGSSGNETTLFGAKTYAAVVNFQKANILTSDGIVGPLTRAIINKN